MAQRDMNLVLEEDPSSNQASGVWSVRGNDQGESMAFAVHDAKNMLGALQANVHWLRESMQSAPASSPEDIAQAIDDMDTCCQRLATLLSQALMAAKGQKISANPSRVHVGALVGHAIHQVRKQAEARRVEVRTSVRADVVTMLDGLLVARVLDNLLNNAISYSRPGSAVVIEYGTENNDVYFAVSDEGPGISEALRERIFEPFVTETRPTLPAGAPAFHAGLGLAFCKAVARAHGGDITHTNRASGGAMFVVTIPWARSNRLSMVPR